MPETKISVDLPEELGKRLKSESEVLGLSPELTAVFLLARVMRQEKQPDMQGMRVILPQFMQPCGPQAQPAPEPEHDSRQEREEQFVAANQRMFAMNIASNLMGIGEGSGKSPEEVWDKFEEYYVKIHDKMVKDNGVDGMISGAGPEPEKR